jgi:hypothetical protein
MVGKLFRRLFEMRCASASVGVSFFLIFTTAAIVLHQYEGTILWLVCVRL